MVIKHTHKHARIISCSTLCIRSSPVSAAASSYWSITFCFSPRRVLASHVLNIRDTSPQVRYGSRKKIADSRPRVKGRFIKTVEQVTAASGPAAGQ